jgi:hypothetical protein
MKNLTKKNLIKGNHLATFNSLSSPKKLTFQRYAKQKSKPLTSDAILRCYAYLREEIYGKTKQDFIKANGKPFESKPSESKLSSSPFPSYVEGEVPLVLHELYSTDKINAGWVNENGLIVAKLEGEQAKLDADLWEEIIIGTYEWEYLKPKQEEKVDLSNPENYLFTYTLELEIVENNPSSGEAEYYHIEIR